MKPDRIPNSEFALALLPAILSLLGVTAFAGGYLFSLGFDSRPHLLVTVFGLSGFLVSFAFAAVIRVKNRRIPGLRRISNISMASSGAVFALMVGILAISALRCFQDKM